MTRPGRTSAHVFLRLALIAGLLMAWVGVPAVASASTADSMETAILSWINEDRLADGLRPYRLDAVLVDIAGERAGRLAAAGILSHDVAGGSIGDELSAQGYTWYSTGEDIGLTTSSWGLTSARSLYLAWKGSPAHWALLMSDHFNYVGVGIAYRSATGATYGSVVMTEASDHSRPGSKMAGDGRSGTTIWFTWRGWDVLLQTHTAGLRDFDVGYRMDSGSWRTIRGGATATGLSLSSRSHGHRYWLRVRARDWQGNLSAWSAPLSVWVP